jgi:HSP20 family protein
MFWTDTGQYGRTLDLWREFERMSRLFSEFPAPFARTTEFPAVNVWSNGNEAVVTAELPGVDPSAADISVVGKTLTIKASRRPEETGEDGSYHRQERWTGSFTRTIELPFLIEQNKVEARFSKGILEINLPRAEADKPKKIAITSH